MCVHMSGIPEAQCARCTPPAKPSKALQVIGAVPKKQRKEYSENELAVIAALDANPDGLTADGISAWLDENRPRIDENGKPYSWGHNSTSSLLILDTAMHPGKLIMTGEVIPVSRERTGITRNGNPAREFRLAVHVPEAERKEWLETGLIELQQELIDRRIETMERQLEELRAKRRDLRPLKVVA